MEEKNANNDKLTTWVQIKESLDSIMLLKSEFIDEKTDYKILINAFQDVVETTKVLQFFLFFTHKNEIDTLKNIFKYILNISIEGSPTNISLARRVISQIDKKWINENIIIFLNKELIQNNDEWGYRRAAELLKHLDLQEKLLEHLKNCKENQDPEIQEIYEDFK